MNSSVIFLVGATATGKTSISLELSQRFPIEIVNADSLQVFRELDIGTAKPSKPMMLKTPHHLIDILDPDQEFTAKEYKVLAEEKISQIQARGKIPLFVGGAGFYLKALSSPTLDLPSGCKKIEDFTEAYKELTSKDPEATKKIHPNDHYRISRALFLLDQDILPSRAFERVPSGNLDFEIVWFGISCPRKTLRSRIEERVQRMFDAGIIQETESVLHHFPKSRARLEKTIGYGECLSYLEGKISKTQAQTLTTTHTQQYAKRQDTWFRKNSSIVWSTLDTALDHFSLTMDKLNQV